MLDHLDRCLLYHSGELPGPQRSAHELHRGSCPACRELEAAMAAGSAAASACALELPAGARARAVSTARSPRPAPARGLALAAAIALALVALRPGRQPLPGWHDLDRDSARLEAELASISFDIARSETDLEIDAELSRIESRTRAAGLDKEEL